jgi:hypothetical protein
MNNAQFLIDETRLTHGNLTAQGTDNIEFLWEAVAAQQCGIDIEWECSSRFGPFLPVVRATDVMSDGEALAVVCGHVENQRLFDFRISPDWTPFIVAQMDGINLRLGEVDRIIHVLHCLSFGTAE